MDVLTQKKEERALIKQAQENPEKFAPLYDKYHKPILLFVFKRVEDFETASDLTSQVFINAIRNIKKFEDRGFAFSSWLYRIAINEVNMHYRKNKSSRIISIEIVKAGELIAEINSNKEDLKILEKVLLQLKENELQLIEMRFFEERSFKEIGELLVITENNAKVRTYRILEKLKNSFKSFL